MGALGTALVSFLIDLLAHVLDVLLAAGNEVDFLHVALNWDVKNVLDTVAGSTTSLLNQESEGCDFVEQRKTARVGHSVQHNVDALLLDEDLVDVTSGAARVSEAEAGKNILLVNVPQIRVVVDSFGRDREKLGLRGELDLRVGDNPLLLRADLHQSELLDVLTLRVEDAAGGTSAVDSKGGANQCAASLALDVRGRPDAVNSANREVALNDGAAVDGIESNEVRAVLVEDGLLGDFLRSVGCDDLGRLKVLGDDVVRLDVDVGLELAELVSAGELLH